MFLSAIVRTEWLVWLGFATIVFADNCGQPSCPSPGGLAAYGLIKWLLIPFGVALCGGGAYGYNRNQNQNANGEVMVAARQTPATTTTTTRRTQPARQAQTSQNTMRKQPVELDSVVVDIPLDPQYLRWEQKQNEKLRRMEADLRLTTAERDGRSMVVRVALKRYYQAVEDLKEAKRNAQNNTSAPHVRETWAKKAKEIETRLNVMTEEVPISEPFKGFRQNATAPNDALPETGSTALPPTESTCTDGLTERLIVSEEKEK